MSNLEVPKLSVLISPGQSTHKENMWELAEKYPEVREAYEIADEAVIDIYGLQKINGKNISEWSQGDNSDEISVNTRLAQPLLVATSIGLNEVLSNREHFTTSYGNSLGELAALVAAGSLSKEHAIKLAVVRGICSYEASQKSPGRMVVIKNATHDFLSQLKQGEEHGIKRAINFSPSSITLSGTEVAIKHIAEKIQEGYKSAVRRAKDLSKEDRRKLQNAIMLKIPGGFHSFLMEHAKKEFNDAFSGVEITPPSIMNWFSNHSGRFEDDPTTIQEHLVNQLTHEVNLWEHVGQLVILGHSRFVESGTAPHITDEYQRQQALGNLRTDIEFIFGLDALGELAA